MYRNVIYVTALFGGFENKYIPIDEMRNIFLKNNHLRQWQASQRQTTFSRNTETASTPAFAISMIESPFCLNVAVAQNTIVPNSPIWI